MSAEALLQPPAAPALDLHEGIATPPDPERVGCARWPEHLRLVNDVTGELVRGRCKATNLCTYCARLAAVETSELLMLDAMEDSPSVYVVLTARNHLERAECRQHLRKLLVSLRRRWPAIAWAVIVEFQRRGALHLNLLVKGVPVDDVAELHAHAARIWCARPGVDARPEAQFVGSVSDGGGLVRYIALHFLKPEQAPPIGWRGHRISYTGGYLVRPAAELREEAKRSLRYKRALFAAIRAGHAAEDVERVATERVELAEAVRSDWRIRDDPAIAERRRQMPARGARAGVPVGQLVAAAIDMFGGEELW